MSFKAEVITDNTGKWYSNALRFTTNKEAQIYVDNLMMRWTAVRDTRVVECDDAVTARLEINEAEKVFQIVHLSTPAQ